MPRHFLAVVLAALAVLACGGEPAPLPADLTPVDHPELSTIEAAARRQLEKQRAAIDQVLAEGGDRLKLAGAFGGLGEHYHAYELLGAAAACYRNAEKLDPESFLWPYYLGALQQTSGDLEGAAASLERALELRDDKPVRRRLGEVRLALGDAPAAREQFQALLHDDAYAAAGHFGLGRAAAVAGKPRRAVSYFERVLKLQPEAGIVHYPLGQALRSLGRLEDARAQLAEQATGEVRSPDRLIERMEALAISSGAYLKRGNQALMSGRLEEAETELRGAVAADPEATAARRNLAQVLLRRGDSAGATSELEAAAAIDPDDVWVHFDLGNAYLSRRLGESAVSSFERAVELDPTLVSAHFNLANALISAERWSDARPHLETVLRLDPGHLRARYQYAIASDRTGDHAAAVRELHAVVTDEPEFTAARIGLAEALVKARRGRDAIAVYREGLDLDLPAAEKIELLNALAQLAWRRGQRPRAIASWRRVTDLEPESSIAWTNLANAMQLSGKRPEARRLFAKAVKLDPQNATAWLSEGRLLILERRFQLARQRLETAIAQVPDHAGLKDTLSRLLSTCSDARIRDGRRAMALAQQAYALEGKIEYAETFGMALAELGRFEEAIRWQHSVINEAARIGDQDAMPRLAAMLRSYEQREPIRMANP